MVKQRRKNTKKKRFGKGFKVINVEARKITASTEYETYSEQLSPFVGLLALIKLKKFHFFCPEPPFKWLLLTLIDFDFMSILRYSYQV